jgi:hypothetical protein
MQPRAISLGYTSVVQNNNKKKNKCCSFQTLFCWFSVKGWSSGVPHDPLLPPTASARSWN